MPAFSFEQARQCVLQTVGAARATPLTETVALETAAGRVLAEPVPADRDYPALARSVRDGYAVRARDLPGEFTVIGEVRAGESFPGEVAERQAVEIMTGAPVPRGADAVVMLEHVAREGPRLTAGQPAAPGQFVNPQGSEARAGEILLHSGRRLDYTGIAMLAAAGRQNVLVYAAPRVAIIATGDEIVPVTATPREFQIRNSNVYSLAAQVARAGGVPGILPVARDEVAHTRELIERGLDADLLLLSGGVSAGKYDIVERVLEELGAKFFFDRVLIQPGQPLVFGQARGKFFFGLPGNPSSTMVTFEIFARAAVELLGGQDDATLHMPYARLTQDFQHKPGLTRFLPACLSHDGAEVTPVAWHGSSDVPAMTRANAYMVVDADRASWQTRDWIRVMLK
ncbi:MAG TPA: gephyrin-like molybdotransferase Glp [Bryobacteraceae bacterium]|nr:gephyrin-like molybdotransferase Glp [Bryobacteraceae bacterium]